MSDVETGLCGKDVQYVDKTVCLSHKLKESSVKIQLFSCALYLHL